MAEPAPRRGRTHDAEGAREAILNAAEENFAEHGFDGARIDAIAAASGYNKSLIFQYFDDKLGLYSAVIRRADDQSRDLQMNILSVLVEMDTTVDPEKFREAISTYMRAYFDYLVEHPHVTRILGWEMAEGWQTYTKIISQRDFDDIEKFKPLFEKIQKLGWLRPDMDATSQIFFVDFLFPFYLSCLPLFQVLLPGKDYKSRQALEAARDFIIDLVVNGVFINLNKETKVSK